MPAGKAATVGVDVVVVVVVDSVVDSVVAVVVVVELSSIERAATAGSDA